MIKKPYKTYAIAQASIVEDISSSYKALAAVSDKLGFEIQPQIDLLYVKSVLVTEGINDNDDVFLKDELWAARATPILKPSNWQHSDTEIIGVVYSVEAQDINKNVISLDSEEPPKEAYEFITEAAVFKLIFPEKAKEIAARYAKGNLYVSMEAWFDDFDYALYDKNGNLEKLIARNKETAFLDKNLRANGGTGLYEGKRLGRALRNITFGGFGFVDRPANKRSHILEVQDFEPAKSQGDEMVNLLRHYLGNCNNQVINGSLIQSSKEENTLMSATANNNNELSLDQIENKVAQVLDRKSAEQAKAAEERALRTRATELESTNQTLTQELNGVKANLSVKEKDLEQAQATINTLEKAVSDFSISVAQTVGVSVPDGVQSFASRLDWVTKAFKTLAEQAAKAVELEKEIAVAARAMREQEVKHLFASVLSDEEINVLIQASASLSDEAYENWFKEKELFAIKLKGSSDVSRPNTPKPVNSLAELVERLKSGFQQGSLGVDSGVNAGTLKTPRFKIAGTADELDPANILDGLEDDGAVNLAGAQASAESDEDNPFRTLARELCGFSDKEDNKEE